MANLKAKLEGNKLNIHSSSIIAVIDYDDNRKINASLILGDSTYRLEPDSDKNITVTENSIELLKFKFDYMWGGATLIIDGENTSYQITGKVFKKGTRLIDGDKNDMVVVTTVPDFFSMTEFDIEVTHPEVTDFLKAVTVYYHIYISIRKQFLANSIY